MIRQPTRSLISLAVLLVTSFSSANGQSFVTSDPTPAPVWTPDCTVHNGCLNCVSAGCAWGIGTCFASCDQLPEMACYALQPGYSPDNNAATICDKQSNQAYDAANCGVQTTCEACTSTELTSAALEDRQEDAFATPPPFGTTAAPVPTCHWYEDRKTCSHLECDSVGCASPYCPDTPEGQCYFGADDCTGCLDIEEQTCSWSENSCELACLEGTECYSPIQFPTLDREGICRVASNFAADKALCFGLDDCGSCTSAIKSDGTNCQWYYDDFTRQGWCGMGGCDVENNLCGLDSCEGVPENAAYTECEAMSTLDPEDLTCEGCLEVGCGWTTAGQCIGTCGGVADIACYEVEEFQTVQSVCNEANIAIADASICGTKTPQGCEECTKTLKSDRRTTCEWYEESFSGTAYCGVGGCDGLGNCGSATCSDAAGPGGNCNLLFNCQACLNNPPCAWNDGTCYEDCNAVPFGATCYSPDSQDFAFQSNFAICRQSDEASSGATSGTAQITTEAPASDARSSKMTVAAAAAAAAAALVTAMAAVL